MVERLSPDLRDICTRLDRLVRTGSPQEQELAIRLLHEISDEVGKAKWEGSTKVSRGTQQLISI